MSRIFYVSDGKLYSNENGSSRELRSLTIDTYLRTAKEIDERKEWKSTGQGATFMGIALEQVMAKEEIHTGVEAVAAIREDKLIYAATTETSCGLFSKNPEDPDEPEGYVTRKLNTRFFSVDYAPEQKQLVLSVKEGVYDRHLALCGEDKANYRVLTEGDSVDISPSFSRKDSQVIYFSSAGYYVDKSTGRQVCDTYHLCRLDMRTNDIEDVLYDGNHDYLSPREAADGTLYCIRRPKEKEDSKGATLLDVLLIPVKMLRAVFGWMNFFSRKYSGESLVKRSDGTNPAKQKDKSEEDIFIEGNLLKIRQSLKENELRGEKYPGLAPRCWELVRVGSNGDVDVVKKGVLSFGVDPEDGSVVYSNGRYLLRIDSGGNETKLCEAKLASSISIL